MAIVLGLAVIVIIGFILIVDPFANDDDEPDTSAMRVTTQAI